MSIPSSVTSIGNAAFGGCSRLAWLEIHNADCEISNYSNDPAISSAATICGHDGSTAQAFASKNGNPFVSLDAPGRWGDVNGTGDADEGDLAVLFGFITGEQASFKASADLQPDGKIDLKDVTALYQHLHPMSS